MSGPKYSDYVLERQRLLQIQAQLEAELEFGKCRQITTQINECVDKSKLYFSQINIAQFENNIASAETRRKFYDSIIAVQNELPVKRI